MRKIGVVLASGIGSRVNNKIPKQFMMLNGKHVLSYSVKAFLENEKINDVIVVVSNENLNYAKEILSNYIDVDNISFVIGGSTRTESVNNAIVFISNNNDVNDEDIVLVHDSARPLLSRDVIDRSIDKIKDFECVTTAVVSTDTICLSTDGNTINKMMNRDEVFNIQTPQTFKINKYLECFDKINKEDIEFLTDSTKVFRMNQFKIGLVKGNKELLKITTKEDFKILESFIR